jgi:protocatechuate 3,4-dioxygenase beta subunit
MHETDGARSRRAFLGRAARGAVGLGLARFFEVPGLMAEGLTLTPRQTEGPFYPDRLPLDTDNDLIVLNDSLTPAIGTIAHLGGRVRTASGAPVRNALVEIWQVDGRGVYLHSGDTHAARDAGFQGFGRFLTGSSGEYYFRTLKPVRYPGRTPHIHVAVKTRGRDRWTTQCYVKGEPQNEHDGIYRSIRDPKARESVTVDFAPLPGSAVGEVTARFDIVMGFTPEA